MERLAVLHAREHGPAGSQGKRDVVGTAVVVQEQLGRAFRRQEGRADVIRQRRGIGVHGASPAGQRAGRHAEAARPRREGNRRVLPRIRGRCRLPAHRLPVGDGGAFRHQLWVGGPAAQMVQESIHDRGVRAAGDADIQPQRRPAVDQASLPERPLPDGRRAGIARCGLEGAGRADLSLIAGQDPDAWLPLGIQVVVQLQAGKGGSLTQPRAQRVTGAGHDRGEAVRQIPAGAGDHAFRGHGVRVQDDGAPRAHVAQQRVDGRGAQLPVQRGDQDHVIPAQHLGVGHLVVEDDLVRQSLPRQESVVAGHPIAHDADAAEASPGPPGVGYLGPVGGGALAEERRFGLAGPDGDHGEVVEPGGIAAVEVEADDATAGDPSALGRADDLGLFGPVPVLRGEAQRRGQTPERLPIIQVDGQVEADRQRVAVGGSPAEVAAGQSGGQRLGELDVGLSDTGLLAGPFDTGGEAPLMLHEGVGSGDHCRDQLLPPLQLPLEGGVGDEIGRLPGRGPGGRGPDHEGQEENVG